MKASYIFNDIGISTPCQWLPPTLDAVTELIIREAQACIGARETAPNRGPQIDEWLIAANVPKPVIQAGNGFWCAAFVGWVWKKAGITMPAGYADCDVLMAWGKRTKRWSSKPSLGALVLYGKPGDAKHVGIIVDTATPAMSVEGNTTVEGSQFERNGTAVALKLIQPNDPVLGYVSVQPAA